MQTTHLARREVVLRPSSLMEDVVPSALSTSARYPIMISPLSLSVLFDCASVGAKLSAGNKVVAHEKLLRGCCSEQEKKKGNKKTSGLEHLRVTALAHCGIYEDIFPDLV